VYYCGERDGEDERRPTTKALLSIGLRQGLEQRSNQASRQPQAEREAFAVCAPDFAATQSQSCADEMIQMKA
jgi:hypothetical protein